MNSTNTPKKKTIADVCPPEKVAIAKANIQKIKPHLEALQARMVTDKAAHDATKAAQVAREAAKPVIDAAIQKALASNRQVVLNVQAGLKDLKANPATHKASPGQLTALDTLLALKTAVNDRKNPFPPPALAQAWADLQASKS